MILYPAIDIMDGQAVRLVEGRFEDATTYHDDPLEAARSWVEAGARFLHVVDLDGARAGEPRVARPPAPDRRRDRRPGPVRRRPAHASTPCARRCAAGAERAIVGTAAFRDVDFLDDIVAAFGPRIVVSVDVARRHDRHRRLDADDRAAGRATRSAPRPTAACARSSTPTSTATASSTGPTSTASQRVAEAVRGRFLYSGGIGSLDDLRALARAAPGQPRRRDRRQGALREEVHRGRGPGALDGA